MRLALIYCAIPSELGAAKKSYFKLFKFKKFPPHSLLLLSTPKSYSRCTYISPSISTSLRSAHFFTSIPSNSLHCSHLL